MAGRAGVAAGVVKVCALVRSKLIASAAIPAERIRLALNKEVLTHHHFLSFRAGAERRFFRLLTERASASQ
jgi:hypothetical protein